jgi:hypothetical protein
VLLSRKTAATLFIRARQPHVEVARRPAASSV